MVDRIDMEYKIEVLSGDAKTTSVYTAATGVTDLEEGNCVEITATGWDVAGAENNTGGLVIRGQVDDKSVAAINKPVVLLGEAIVRLDKVAFDGGTLGALAVGDAVNMTATGVKAVATATLDWGTVLQIDTVNGDWAVLNIK